MCTTDELNLVFDETGKQFGYLTVRAEFAEMKEFKVKWQRGHDWIDLMIPDYLEDAPSEVLEDLALSIFSKIGGKERGYGKAMRSFVKDRRFAENNREKYLKRTGMMMSGPHRVHLYLARILSSEIQPSFLADSRPFRNSPSRNATDLSLRIIFGSKLTLKGRPPTLRAIWKNTFVASESVIPHLAKVSSNCLLYSGFILI